MRSFHRLGTAAFLVASATLAACSATDQTSPTPVVNSADRGGSTPRDTTATQNPSGGSTANKVIVALAPSADFPGARGKAQFDARSNRRELEIEVEHVRQLAGQTLTFSLGGTAAGTARVDTLGSAEFKLRSQAGQNVPASVAGLAVSVATSSGTVIVSGSF